MLRLQKNIERTTNDITIPAVIRENWGTSYDVLDGDGKIIIRPGDTYKIQKKCKLYIPIELTDKYGKQVYMIFGDGTTNIYLEPTSKGE